MKKMVIDEKYNGKKLNFILHNIFPTLSLNTFYKALRKKDIKVNGKRIHEDMLLYTGDSVEIYISDDLLYIKNGKLFVERNIGYT